MNYAIITGGSRGLGAAISKELLLENIHIISISRNENEELKTLAEANGGSFETIPFDLSLTEEIPSVMKEIFEKISLKRAEKIFLINNAGVVTPIKALHLADPMEISDNIAINLIAPLLITSSFIYHTEKYAIDKRIINISSGSAQNPVYGWSSYGSSKAGINLFSQTVAIEQKQLKHPTKICAFAPGVLDTDMQAEIRSTDKSDFTELARFQAYKAEGNLLSADTVATVISNLLYSEQFPNGKIVSINDYV
ncbi:(S)-benzoin forming benzil reductase [Alkalihalobacillus trypoxylicola]|uniref:Short-chain dehydrogenase n=1 Tax=Alkalihalobacillus trypoxylicola TaxID=519424 RepID=A0A162CWS7_9BACI|nr:(S)-benzoin forming benzil reductase [Alkalihalobacillus trypoxylicola]KYG26959.1 short-chain dehydrogenase [Alkalihalobacillus trypoxylicola]